MGRARAGVGSVVVDPVLACLLNPDLACAADRRTASVVLVIGHDVPDGLVPTNHVPQRPHPAQLGFEHGRVADAGQVRPFTLEVWPKKLSMCA